MAFSATRPSGTTTRATRNSPADTARTKGQPRQAPRPPQRFGRGVLCPPVPGENPHRPDALFHRSDRKNNQPDRKSCRPDRQNERKRRGVFQNARKTAKPRRTNHRRRRGVFQNARSAHPRGTTPHRHRRNPRPSSGRHECRPYVCGWSFTVSRQPTSGNARRGAIYDARAGTAQAGRRTAHSARGGERRQLRTNAAATRAV